MPGATHKQPETAAGKAARNALIVARRAQGWTVPEIAEEVKLSEEQTKKILRDARRNGDEVGLLRADPVDLIEQVLAERQEDYIMFTHAALAAAENGQLNALIGAIRGRGETSDRIVKILQDTGKIPRELGVFRYIIDFRGIAKQMEAKLAELERAARDGAISEEDVRAVRAFFHEIIGLGGPGSALPPGAVNGSAEEEPPSSEASEGPASASDESAERTPAAPRRAPAKKSSARSAPRKKPRKPK